MPHRRVSLAALAALCAGAAVPSPVYPAQRPSAHRPASVAPHDLCFTPADTTPSPAILAPANNLAVSTSVTLAVAMPSDTTSSVAVCATYQDPPGTSQPMLAGILGNGTGTWAASWDVSSLPGQSGITLSFIAQYPSGSAALIGQRVITIDHTAPTSALAILGPNQYTAPDGVTYVAAATPISLTASDPPLDDGSAGSGATITYQIDGGPAQTFAAPFALGAIGDGPHTIAYHAVDRAGNAEAAHAAQLTLDTQPPVVTPLVQGAFTPDGTAYTPVTVEFAATDAGSGLRSISYDVEPGFAQSYIPGQQIVVGMTSRLDYAAIDEVGNPFQSTLAITVATPTATPSLAQQPANTATATPSPVDTAAPTTAVPRSVPSATRTPRPTPTWPPIAGPPILSRAAPSHSAHGRGKASGTTPVHIHVMPARSTHARKTARCRPGRGCARMQTAVRARAERWRPPKERKRAST